MKKRFSPPFFRSAVWFVGIAFILNILFAATPIASAQSSASRMLGPVLPDEPYDNVLYDSIELDRMGLDAKLEEPMPLPKRHSTSRDSLLQRPKTRQVVFNEIDPVGSVISPSLLHEEELGTELPAVRQRSGGQQTRPTANRNVIFTDDGFHGEIIGEEIIGEYPFEMDNFSGNFGTDCETGTFFSGSIPIAFGMGLLDNVSLFAETTAFKNELSGGIGSMGMGQGINWSTPVTPMGTATAQYGVRTVQGDFLASPSREQLFMTAGLFKRFDFFPLQGGVAVDWLRDSSELGVINTRQMRAELSIRTWKGLETGFMGGFDVFYDRPSTTRIDELVWEHYGTPGAVDVQDYFQFFVRKHLSSGGQVELRTGATAYGDFLLNASGEAALTDRIAVNGGVSMLVPTEGKGELGRMQESWMVSLGMVVYFRGGAIRRDANMYRPMFDVAGNNSLFPRIGRR